MNQNIEPPQIARRVHYSGRVQGVGFRATACHIARQFAVTGWVRNLPADRVELWAEGTEAEVERFLLAIRDYWQNAIQREEVEPNAATGRYDRFTIAR